MKRMNGLLAILGVIVLFNWGCGNGNLSSEQNSGPVAPTTSMEKEKDKKDKDKKEILFFLASEADIPPGVEIPEEAVPLDFSLESFGLDESIRIWAVPEAGHELRQIVLGTWDPDRNQCHLGNGYCLNIVE